MYVTFLHAAELYHFISEDEQKKLVTSKNSIDLFLDIFLSKLEEQTRYDEHEDEKTEVILILWIHVALSMFL